MEETESKGLKEYIKGIKFTLSDFLLMFGFLFSIPFYAFAWKFMVTSDPSTIYFDNRMIIACFVLVIASWATYFILEIKAGRIKNHLFLWVYVFLAILAVITVLVQKTTNIFYVECKIADLQTAKHYPGTQVGDIVKVVATISPTHKLFFACATFVITTIFYIVLIVLPKRIQNMNFLVIIGIITMVFMVGMCIYSYITEADKYIPFVKSFFTGDGEKMKKYAMTSFVVMSVPYGVCMMLAFLFALLAHTITKKSFWYFPAIFYLINMLFSYCRTSIAISYILFTMYVVFRLAATFKQHKIRNSIVLSLVAIVFISLIIFSIISFSTEGSLFTPIYNHLKSFSNMRSYEKRKIIWHNIRDELKGGWIVLGRGFGTHNVMLYPMNLVNGDNVAPSHSTYYAILGAGGLISLLGFFGLMAYYVVLFIKSLKFSKTMPVLLSFGLIGFLAYSFTEGVNYLVVTFAFPLILYYNIKVKDNIKTPNACA